MTDQTIQFTITPLGVTTGQSGAQATPIQFHHVQKGWIPQRQDIGDRAHRLGGDGTLLQSLGTIGAEATFPMQVCFTSKATGLALASSIEGLKDVVCSIVDGWGRSLPRVRVNQVSVSPQAMRGGTVSGAPIIGMIYCIFTFERQPDT